MGAAPWVVGVRLAGWRAWPPARVAGVAVAVAHLVRVAEVRRRAPMRVAEVGGRTLARVAGEAVARLVGTVEMAGWALARVAQAVAPPSRVGEGRPLCLARRRHCVLAKAVASVAVAAMGQPQLARAQGGRPVPGAVVVTPPVRTVEGPLAKVVGMVRAKRPLRWLWARQGCTAEAPPPGVMQGPPVKGCQKGGESATLPASAAGGLHWAPWSACREAV